MGVLPKELHIKATDDDADYDEGTHTCTIHAVRLNNHHYRVKLRLQSDNRFSLFSAEPIATSRIHQPADYDDNKQTLNIPQVQVNGRYFKARLQNSGNFNFLLVQIEEIK